MINQAAFGDIELPEDFEPMGVFMEGQKDKNGSVLVSSNDILNGKINKDDDDDDLSDEQKAARDNQKKVDDLLEKSQGGAADDDNDDDLDNDDEDPDNPKNKAKGKSGDDNGANPLLVYYNMMVKEGLWEEEEEEFDGSEEKFLEIKEKNIEKMRDEDINEYLDKAFTKNPDGKQYGKTLLAHLAAGGKLRDFVEINQGVDVTEEELDSEEEGVAESAAESLTASYLKLIGWEPNDIRDFIKTKKEKNLLIDYAKEHMKPYQKQVAKANEDRITAEKENELARKRNAIQYTTKVNEIVTTLEKVGTAELPKTPKEKKALLNYMLTPIELEDGRTMPQFTADYIKLSKDPEFNVFLATALQSWNAKGGKKTTQKSSTKDEVQSLLSGKRNDDNNSGKDRRQAPQPVKKTKSIWSFN